jgi:hypothetical protein
MCRATQADAQESLPSAHVKAAAALVERLNKTEGARKPLQPVHRGRLSLEAAHYLIQRASSLSQHSQQVDHLSNHRQP